MGQTNSIICCTKNDETSEQVDMESEVKKDKEKDRQKGKDIKALKRKIAKKREQQRANGLELLKKKTSKLKLNQDHEISRKSTNAQVSKLLDEKDPDTFIPEVPSLEDLENDEELQSMLTDERKKAIYYWYEAHDEAGWEKFDEKDGVSMHYYGTDYENEFYIKRCFEINKSFKETYDYFYGIYAIKATSTNSSKIEQFVYDDIEMSMLEHKSKKALKKACGKKYTPCSAKYNCRNEDVIVINHDTEQDYSPEIKSVKGVSNGITILKPILINQKENKTYIINVQVLNMSGKIDPNIVKKVLRKHFESLKDLKKEMEEDEEENN